MERSPEDFQAFVEAVQKEEASWAKWKSIKPLSPPEATKIMSTPALRQRIIPSRGCYRDKTKGQGPLQAKCRIVAQGHVDPDLKSLTRQAPTPSRTSEMVILALYASGANGKAFNNKARWTLWFGDAATAFLQGRQAQEERNGPLDLRPPRDPLIKAAGAFPHDLYVLEGNVYGLSNGCGAER